MSTRELVTGYLHERFPMRVYVPLAAVLVLFAGAGARPMPSGSWALHAFVMIVPLLLTLRIVDDVADRTHDRSRHPARITVRTADVQPLLGLAGAALAVAAAAALLRRTPPSSALLLGATVSGLAAWYAVRASLGAGRMLNTLIVLLKYPAIVVAAAPMPMGGTVAALAVTAYLGVLLHDLADDPDLLRTNGGTS